MSDLKDYQERWYDRVVAGALILSYIIMVICTAADNGFATELFSTLTSFLSGTLIMICLSRMGNFAFPSFLLGIGIYMWALGDLIGFVAVYILNAENPPDIVDTLYIFPNYFFGASVALYFIQKLKGRALYQFLVNVFTFTVIGFVFLRKLLIWLNAYNTMERPALIRVYLYFFINLFILIMIFHMVYMIAAESGLKGSNTMILGIFVYILMDFPYNYLTVIGEDPDIPWINPVYMICMMLMAHGIFHQVRHRHVFRLKEHEYNEKTIKRTRIVILAGMAASILLFFTGFLDRNELFYLLIALMGYWVTTASFQNGALNEQLIRQQDLLTGLFNRRYSTDVIGECIKATENRDYTFCIYCIDLNHFKPINDTYGHDMGDRVLKEYGSRMLALPDDYVSFRTGGDEFMVVRKDIRNEDDVREGAETLLELYRTPVELDTYVFHLSGSIGAAIYRTHTEDKDELIRYADAAMYVVKHSDRKDDYKLFDRDLVQTVEKHRELELDLRNAVPEKDFILYYQPRLDLKTGTIIGAEAYPRLKGKKNEAYTAADLIPIAEETGLMSKLGIWIAEESIRTLSGWRKEYQTNLSIKINLAPLQLLDVEFLDRLKRLTKEYDVPADRIYLDISNEVIMGAGGSSKSTLKELSDFGFRLSLNDFGGGDINLSHILDCGFKEIDISHSLISRSMQDPEALALIRSVSAIAETMNIAASAVGIETQEQAELMKYVSLTGVQGFYYGRPVPPDMFSAAYLA